MPPGSGFLTRTVETDHGRRKYSLFIPAIYRPGSKFPAILFLHGRGESGRDGVRPRTVGIGPAIARQATTFDFIVIFPQVTGNWKGVEAEHIAVRALEDVQRHYAVDPNRIALSGLSTGGEGTWLIGAAQSQRFAALVPLCAYGVSDVAHRLAKMPIWAFHNEHDLVVAARNTREMVRALDARGGDIRYSEFDAIGHNCWDKAYAKRELFDWLRNQRRSTLSR